jgi:glycosyltransferase involved in cell wall biosynthesis
LLPFRYLATLLSAAVHLTPRALALAASIAWRHLSADPVRAVLLAWRVLPPPLRRVVAAAGPYGRATALWGAGERTAAMAALNRNPSRLAAFALAVDQPATARAAIARLADDDPKRPYLAAQLAWREGRLTDAIGEFGTSTTTTGATTGATAHAGRSRRARRLRRTLAAQRTILTTEPAVLDLPGSPATVLDLPGPAAAAHAATLKDTPPGQHRARVLHLVTDALPATSAGYTIRTHEIVRAQLAAGLDPHVVTGLGFPVTKGILDGRATVVLDAIPYHRLLPWTMPRYPDTARAKTIDLAARLTTDLAADRTAGFEPDVLHAASNYVNAQVALALRDRLGIPVVYEVRGFWEDTWLSRHPEDEQALAASELYQAIRAAETACMRAADVVVTLGEAMRAEIASRGIPMDQIEIVPNAVDESFLEPLPRRPKPESVDDIAFTVGTVTTLTPHEGIGTLLEAVRLLTERGVPARALIVGDGPEKAALERQAQAAGTPATFTGRVPAAKVRDYHALLDVFVVPRTRDRVCQLVTPLKPVEAMASGLCVVTSEVSALSEIVKHEVTGVLTVPQDPVSLADKLEWLFYNPDIRAKLGAAAREWVAGDRTWTHNAERYRAVYQRVGVG